MQNPLLPTTFPGSRRIAGTAAAPRQLTGASALGGHGPTPGCRDLRAPRLPRREVRAALLRTAQEKAIALPVTRGFLEGSQLESFR